MIMNAPETALEGMLWQYSPLLPDANNESSLGRECMLSLEADICRSLLYSRKRRFVGLCPVGTDVTQGFARHQADGYRVWLQGLGKWLRQGWQRQTLMGTGTGTGTGSGAQEWSKVCTRNWFRSVSGHRYWWLSG